MLARLTRQIKRKYERSVTVSLKVSSCSVEIMNRGGSSKSTQHNLHAMPYSVVENDLYKSEPTLYTVKGMAILDNDGNRILAKYYDKNIFPTPKEQKAFEKNLFNKTHRANAEIIMLDGLTCVYRSNVDLFFYVMGSSHENELILMSVLNCLYDSVSQILRKNVEKRAVLDSLDIVMLAMDEICDGGIILDADATSVVQRVALRTDDIPLGEQTVAQVLQSAKEQLKWSLLK
ncbi:coatomer subunit zeta-1 isoform X2 [Vespa velutina]|uniref:coatomer subunit zeta-1 isoform X2 n=1 Tax=Vespa velutina TaxID=202808 RepID=UPI001FB455D4|nr:coatomer subunit zeta-1 isoform X2 [Vespa velutina]